jgi:glycine cleavage system transcriptional repressor
MARFSLHTVGKDRPGIIAGVTGALASLGVNLEDSRMTILRGQCAFVVVLDAPGISDGGHIEGALERVAEELNLFVVVRPTPEEVTPTGSGEWFWIVVDGADHPGIVAGIAEAIASVGGNIVELASRLLERDGHSGYVLRLSVTVPEGVTIETISSIVADASDALGVSSSVSTGDGELA